MGNVINVFVSCLPNQYEASYFNYWRNVCEDAG